MKFSTLRRSYGKAEQRGWFSITLGLECGERSRMTFDGLRAFALHGVQLHSTYYTVLLSWDAWIEKFIENYSDVIEDWNENINV